MKEILRDYDEVWEYYLELKSGSEDSCLMIVAKDEEYGVEIVIDYEKCCIPIISVYIDDVIVESVEVSDEEECELICTYFYDTYLSGDIGTIYEALQSVDESAGDFNKSYYEIDEEEIYDEIEEEIDERNMELCETTRDFLDVMLLDAKGNTDKVFKGLLKDVVNLVGKHLKESYGISIRWPGFSKDEDGNSVYSEYPFDK